MRREQLAASLWWVDYNGNGPDAFKPSGEYSGHDLVSISLNFLEWTSGAKERNRWRRAARELLRQSREVAYIVKATQQQLRETR